jgi:hypothetical protein
MHPLQCQSQPHWPHNMAHNMTFSRMLCLSPAVPPGGPEKRDPVDADLPIRGFGPWTYPQTQNGCQYSFNTYSTSDAWPYGICTLKRVPDPKRPKYVAPAKAAAQRSAGKQQHQHHQQQQQLG